MNAADAEEAAREFDAIIADFRPRYENCEIGVGELAEALLLFASRYGYLAAVHQKRDGGWAWVYTLPGDIERVDKQYGYFRSLLAGFWHRANAARGFDIADPRPLEVTFTEEEITEEYERLRICSVQPDDAEYDIKARRNRVLRSLRQSPMGKERARQLIEDYHALNLYGFSVTVGYPVGDGQTVPLYIETWNNTPGQKAYAFTLRRLELGDERSPVNQHLKALAQKGSTE